MTVASASVYPVTIHWIVSSDVSNVVDRWLIATLTTVVSRMDMITPRTTTTATLSSARSSFVSAAVSVVAVAVSDGMATSLAKVEAAPPLFGYPGAYERGGQRSIAGEASAAPGRRAQPGAHPGGRGGRIRRGRARGDD